MSKLDTKVKILYFKLNQTDEIVEKRERQSLERHQSLITSIVSAVDTLKTAVEEKKFIKGGRDKNMERRNPKPPREVDQATNRIQSAIQAIDMEEQEKKVLENHELQMEFEREILEQKAEFEKNVNNKKQPRKRPNSANRLQLPSSPNYP